MAPQAPRDEDCYIRPPLRPPATIAMSRRLSQERRFLRKLEASLDRAGEKHFRVGRIVSGDRSVSYV